MSEYILVCGGRDYSNREYLCKYLDELWQSFSGAILLQGGCPTGADRMAKEWAQDRGVPFVEVPADWKTHGKAAGFIRNKEMLRYNPVVVVGFPGGSGTAHMLKIARQAGVHTIRLETV